MAGAVGDRSRSAAMPSGVPQPPPSFTVTPLSITTNLTSMTPVPGSRLFVPTARPARYRRCRLAQTGNGFVTLWCCFVCVCRARPVGTPLSDVTGRAGSTRSFGGALMPQAAATVPPVVSALPNPTLPPAPTRQALCCIRRSVSQSNANHGFSCRWYGPMNHNTHTHTHSLAPASRNDAALWLATTTTTRLDSTPADEGDANSLATAALGATGTGSVAGSSVAYDQSAAEMPPPTATAPSEGRGAIGDALAELVRVGRQHAAPCNLTLTLTLALTLALSVITDGARHASGCNRRSTKCQSCRWWLRGVCCGRDSFDGVHNQQH